MKQIRTYICMIISLLTAAFCLAAPDTASAYEIGGRFGHSCHEIIAYDSFVEALDTLAKHEDAITLPDDEETNRLIDAVQDYFTDDGESFTRKEAFILMSLMVGVRAPDSGGHASSNLAHTRAEHANKDDEAQYIHALRGMHDDFGEGDFTAEKGIHASFLKSTRNAYQYRSVANKMLNIREQLFIDYYGMIDINVNASAYYYGYAAHLVADSFSHTIRSQADDFTKIITFMNYVEVIYPTYSKERDGLPHSEFADDCFEEANAPVVNAAIRATDDYENAFEKYYWTGDEQYLEEYWQKWFSLRHECYNNYDLCESQHWVDVANRKVTGPYLECSAAPRRSSSGAGLWLLVPLAIAAPVMRRRMAHSH